MGLELAVSAALDGASRRIGAGKKPHHRGLAEEIRTNRHEDHEAVNDVIIASIDLVQGSVVNEVMPILGVLDTLLGRLDEAVFTATVRSWREHAWDEAQQLLRCSTDDERAAVVDQIHHRALRWAEWIRSL